MTHSRYSPWHVQSGPLQDEVRQVFGRFFHHDDQASVATSQWTPRVDIKEEDNRFAIFADIPGIDPKDIEITMEKSILSIKGERKAENAEQNSKLTRSERSYGAFYRRFALPDSADAEGIKAVGRNGVLEITIPKRAETAARRINVN